MCCEIKNEKRVKIKMKIYGGHIIEVHKEIFF